MTPAQEGGGPTMGHGIHQFDLLLSVLGRWERVTAIAARMNGTEAPWAHGPRSQRETRGSEQFS